MSQWPSGNQEHEQPEAMAPVGKRGNAEAVHPPHPQSRHTSTSRPEVVAAATASLRAVTAPGPSSCASGPDSSQRPRSLMTYLQDWGQVKRHAKLLCSLAEEGARPEFKP